MSERSQSTRADGPGGPGPGPGGSGFGGFDGFDDLGREPREGAPPPRVDLSSLLLVVEGLRRAVPRELQDQFEALLRELLLTIRAVIDWYLERLDGRTREPQVEEIPID